MRATWYSTLVIGYSVSRKTQKNLCLSAYRSDYSQIRHESNEMLSSSGAFIEFEYYQSVGESIAESFYLLKRCALVNKIEVGKNCSWDDGTQKNLKHT